MHGVRKAVYPSEKEMAAREEDADQTGAGRRPEPARRLRVLLGAYSCSPGAGSELGVGWHHALAIARHCDVWVIHAPVEAMERWLARNGEIPSLRFCPLGYTRFELLLFRTRLLAYLAYTLWQRRAWRLAAKLHEEIHFDLAHQVTLTTYREPGYLWRLGIPFVWGPVGGVENYPWRFFARAGLCGAVSEGMRAAGNLVQLRFGRRIGLAAHRAAALITGNSLARAEFEGRHGVTAIQMNELGTTSVSDAPSRKNNRQGALRMLWSGSFIHKKSLHLLLEALRAVPGDCPVELRIVGRGPLERRWKRLARAWGVDHLCRWIPWLPYEEFLALYSWADLHVFTSMRDSTGSVVLEALSHGLPVVCFDHQGCADMVTPGCGVKIPVTRPGETIRRLSETIVSLARDRSRLDRLSEGAAARAGEYLWSRKGEQIFDIYRDVLAKGGGADAAAPPRLERVPQQ